MRAEDPGCRGRGARILGAFLILAAVVLLTGCTTTGHIDVKRESSRQPLVTPTTSVPPATTPAAPVKAAPGVLPQRNRTPGAVNPNVTQANIGQTICVVGWTKTVRPPANYTTALKIHQLQTGYTYKGNTDTRAYEEDHLIPLELGGSPKAVANLWPEPYATGQGARIKDKLENLLHRLVCGHQLSLRIAQHEIAGDWLDTYYHYYPVTPRVAGKDWNGNLRGGLHLPHQRHIGARLQHHHQLHLLLRRRLVPVHLRLELLQRRVLLQGDVLDGLPPALLAVECHTDRLHQ
jgi:hypothetical protein